MKKQFTKEINNSLYKKYNNANQLCYNTIQKKRRMTS